jgi:hypothetical protein
MEQCRQVALIGGGLSGMATLRLKNVDPALTPTSFTVALDTCGFKGLYDFVYVPIDVKRGKNRNIAFVNFKDPATAERFYSAFHNQKMTSVSCAQGKYLEVTPAYIQGFEENFARHCDAEPIFLNCIRCVL